MARQARAFSLVEVIAAMAILAVAASLLGQAVIRSRDAARHSRRITLGTLLAQQRMETILAEAPLPPAKLAEQNGAGSDACSNLRWTQSFDVANSAGWATVTVTVTHPDRPAPVLAQLTSMVRVARTARLEVAP